MEIPSLEDSILISLAVTLWSREGINGNIFKQTNGLIQMENSLMNLKKLVSNLPLITKLINRLTDVIERVGYELYTFITKSPIDVLGSNLNFFQCLSWTPFGIVNEKTTYETFINKNMDQKLLSFKCAAVICSRDQIIQIWNCLPDCDKIQLKSRGHNLIVTYWTYFMEDNTEEFVLSYGNSILGYEPFRSIKYNLVKYSLNNNFKTATDYFFNRLTETERRFINTTQSTWLVQNVLNHPNQEHFKLISSFLEAPTADMKTYNLIVSGIPNEGLLEFIDYLLKQINIFGDLHYKIFRRVVKMSNADVKQRLMLKVDFYVLNLMGKGHLELFEGLLPHTAKSILFQLLSSRLQECKGLALFFTILNNNQQHLLIQCFKYLSNSEADEIFFTSHLNSILAGSQYDTVF